MSAEILDDEFNLVPGKGAKDMEDPDHPSHISDQGMVSIYSQRWLRKIHYLASILQESFKILQDNSFFGFFERILQDPRLKYVPCKILLAMQSMQRSCKEGTSLMGDLTRIRFPCKILAMNTIICARSFSECLARIVFFSPKETTRLIHKGLTEPKTALIMTAPFKLLRQSICFLKMKERTARLVTSEFLLEIETYQCQLNENLKHVLRSLD